MQRKCKSQIVLKIRKETGYINFENQCLSVSIAALPIIRKKYPDARVVIGVTKFSGIAAGVSSHLQRFVTDAMIDFNPPYHAWIELNNSDLLDLTWGSTFKASFPSLESQALDRRDSIRLGLRHIPVLVDQSEITIFYERIMSVNSPGFSHVVPGDERIIKECQNEADSIATILKYSKINGGRIFGAIIQDFKELIKKINNSCKKYFSR